MNTPPPPPPPPPPYRLYDAQRTQDELPSGNQHPYRRHQTPASNSTTNFNPQATASVSSLSLPFPPYPGRERGWQSSLDLVPQLQSEGRPDCRIARGLTQGAALCDNVAAGLQDLLWGLDRDERGINELDELVRGFSLTEQHDSSGDHAGRERAISAAASKNGSGRGLISFQKAWLYQNSRLPPHMLPFVVYMPTWRLFCMAARASVEVYNRPHGIEREHYIDADWRNGTKAMGIKSTPMDDQNLIVFAIRGSQKNLFDWAVNFRPAPTSPQGFLDDSGNACHAGFLSVAKKMVAPVAARLRQLLEQDPSRASSSLLITGHSAGGAVASLLYAHMLSATFESELTVLSNVFKQVHCVTFGAPPVSLLPLQKPGGRHRERSLFISFANEGDPVVRAEKAYILSLAKLLTAPAPSTNSSSVSALKKYASRQKLKEVKASKSPAPYWHVPSAILSTAGRMILLREKPGRSKNHAVEAVCTTDEELRNRVFGDPAMHSMVTYKKRVDQLAIAAVTGASE